MLDLFNSKLCLTRSNHRLKNLENYVDFVEESKQYESSDSQNDPTQPKDVASCSQLRKKDSIRSFHQVDFNEIQVINKNIKGLNRKAIYRTFNTINKNKVILRKILSK